MSKSGIDLLRACVNVANNTDENAFYLHYGSADKPPMQTVSLSALECLKLLTACIESKWDITPDMLNSRERRYAARNGKLSKDCVKRLTELYG